MQEAIEIQNVRPIGHFSFQPGESGIKVIVGHNESGKSKAIDAIGELVGRKSELALEPDPTNLAPSYVSGFGVRITISRRKTPAGELQVDALEGLDPWDLIDPGIADPARADARRFAVICAIAGVKPNLADFARHLGEDPSPMMGSKTRELLGAGLPEFTAKLRADIQERALSFETKAKAHSDRAAGLRQESQELVEDGGRTPEQWSEQRGALGARKGSLQTAIERRKAELEQMKELEAMLASSASDESQRRGILRGELDKRESLIPQFEAEIKELEQLLDQRCAGLVELRNQAKAAREEIERIDKRADKRQEQENKLIQLREQGQSLDSLEGLLAENDKAIAAVDGLYEASVRNKATRERLARADEEWKQALAARKEAERLRAMSDNCERVLSEVAGQVCRSHNLRCEGGRLILRREDGDVPYHVLSGGARTEVAMDLFSDALEKAGKRPVLVVRQEAWAELDPLRRDRLYYRAKRGHLLIITAQPDVGELRTVDYVPTTPDPYAKAS